jgi:CHASE3 domain sensor protein
MSIDPELPYKIRQLKHERASLRNDLLEQWYREYAESLEPSARKFDLLSTANQMKARNDQRIEMIDWKLEELEAQMVSRSS